MLDLFTIFSKGGIVLWCFQGTSQLFTPSVNALIKSVILQVRFSAFSGQKPVVADRRLHCFSLEWLSQYVTKLIRDTCVPKYTIC